MLPNMNLLTAELTRLRDVFNKYPEVLAVYLFGSRAEGRSHRDSDYDLAVVSARGRSARASRLEILADLAQAGFDNIDLSFLDQRNLVLGHEAVRMNQVVFARQEFDRGSFYSKIIRMYLDFVPCLNIQRQALKERLLHGTA